MYGSEWLSGLRVLVRLTLFVLIEVVGEYCIMLVCWHLSAHKLVTW